VTVVVPTWSFIMAKGGVRKTTSSVFVAQSLTRGGTDVLVVDADPGTQSLAEHVSRIYMAGSKPPFHTALWTPRVPLIPFVQDEQRESGARYTIIDVGAEHFATMRFAAMVSTIAVLPVGTELPELARLSETSALVESANGLCPRVVLLTRVPDAGRGRARRVRETLADEGYVVLETEIPHNRTIYSDQFGTNITDLGAYEALTDELADIQGSGVAKHGQ
jgi:cellulose biosynthesis protein BcsQ